MLLAEGLPAARKVAPEGLSASVQVDVGPQTIMTPEFFSAACVGARQRSGGPVSSDDYLRGGPFFDRLAIPRLI